MGYVIAVFTTTNEKFLIIKTHITEYLFFFPRRRNISLHTSCNEEMGRSATYTSLAERLVNGLGHRG